MPVDPAQHNLYGQHGGVEVDLLRTREWPL
jgi:hypothetical protein